MMKSFITEDFLLTGPTAKRLYHAFAEHLPIFDYHCHLPPQDIALNRQFDNLAQAWLSGDHYKWRAMRTNGISEKYITGQAADEDKFMAWAETVPYCVRNPLYHWTHMELKNPFGIDLVLNPDTAREIYARCNRLLQTEEFRAKSLLRKMNVKVLCTTDDPLDDLKNHEQIQHDSDFAVKVLPTMRPDRALAIDLPDHFNTWINKLEEATDLEIKSFNVLVEAIRNRCNFFHQAGCRISDQAVEVPYAEAYTPAEVETVFKKVRQGTSPNPQEICKYRSALLYEFGIMYAEKKWTMQMHIGALRNNNSRMMKRFGPDSGFDSMGDDPIAQPLARFLNRLNEEQKLPKTVLYVLNPKDNDVIGSILGCFPDDSTPGKIQFGSAWWFNDQKDGLQRQIESISNLGLLSRSIGMLTDSRSFLSFPRHDYFRRILCNCIGQDVDKGELPRDLPWLGKVIQDICYHNAVAYFGI